MKFINYLKSLAEANSGQSSKAFAVLASTLISFITGLVLCFAISYDVYVDGVVDSNLEDMGILMLCMGGFVGGSSISKIFGDQAESRAAMRRHAYIHDNNSNYNDSDDDFVPNENEEGQP